MIVLAMGSPSPAPPRARLRALSTRQNRSTITVTVANSAESAEAVSIDDLVLAHTTPRPRGQAPDASGEATGLPLALAPGQTASFTASGTYELVQTDEGKKANLHFRASGHGASSGEPFELGINAHFRAPGVPLD